MTTQMIVRMDSKLKNRMTKFALSEGKTASQVIRELIEEYVRERDMGSYIDELWDRIGTQISSTEFRQTDVTKTIKEVRAGKK